MPFHQRPAKSKKALRILAKAYDAITNTRAGGPANALKKDTPENTNPSQIYGGNGGFNYGQQPEEEPVDIVQPNPSEIYALSLRPIERSSYGDFLSGFIQKEWLTETQISGIELG